MIAFAQGFPSGPAGGPEDRKSPPGLAVLRKFRLDAGQRIALAGALLMVVGVFLPFIQYYRHFFNPSLWEQAVRHGTPLGAASLLLLALLSAVLAVKRWYLGLWITGFIAYMALALAFLLSVKLSYGLPVEAGAGTAESWQAPDFFDFHIGWCVLVLGIVLLFLGLRRGSGAGAPPSAAPGGGAGGGQPFGVPMAPQPPFGFQPAPPTQQMPPTGPPAGGPQWPAPPST